jgi:hypothetical protein
MVNNSTNINKTNKGNNKTTELRTILQGKFKQRLVNNSTNINNTKENLRSDGHQFYQYQQNKTKLK